MPQLKIATFNIEWMVLAFGGRWADWQAGTIPASFPGGTVGGVKHPPIADIHGMCRRIAGVIRDMNAKIVGIEEGPPLKAQLEAFVDRFLDGDYAVHHSNSKWQSICCLVHKSIANRVQAWTPELPALPTYWSRVPYYPWGAITAEERKQHRLDRHPLLLRFQPSQKKTLYIMVVHTKSKFSKLKRREQWESRDREAILDALSARAKLSAEVFRIRAFLDEQLKDPSREIVIMGDLNDGPFAELIEQEFLIHNIVDELVGSLLHPDSYFRHAMDSETLRSAATTRFPDPLQNGAIVEELIDHALVSPRIWEKTGRFSLVSKSCQVESDIYEAHFADTGPSRKRELRPSDHKPVSLVMQH